MTGRSLPPRPHLDQLKRQAEELPRRQPQLARLRDAQRTIAEEYGFVSWEHYEYTSSHLLAVNPARDQTARARLRGGRRRLERTYRVRPRRRRHAAAVARTRAATQPRGILVHTPAESFVNAAMGTSGHWHVRSRRGRRPMKAVTRCSMVARS